MCIAIKFYALISNIWCLPHSTGLHFSPLGNVAVWWRVNAVLAGALLNVSETVNFVINKQTTTINALMPTGHRQGNITAGSGSTAKFGDTAADRVSAPAFCAQARTQGVMHPPPPDLERCWHDTWFHWKSSPKIFLYCTLLNR